MRCVNFFLRFYQQKNNTPGLKFEVKRRDGHLTIESLFNPGMI
jgi:hypothetical protein